MREGLERLPFRAVIVAALAGLPSAAPACSLCACGDPLLAASDPAALAGRLRLQADTEYLRVDAGTDGRPGFEDRLTQWSYRLNAAYRPVDALSVTATVPVVRKSIHTVGGGTDVVASELEGLGDAEIAARYALLRSIALGVGRVQEVAVTGGTSLPTGGTTARASDGTLIDPHGQLGTGAWGPFLGVNYLLEQGSWLASASVSGRLHTEGSYPGGSRYRFGDALLWSLHGQFRPARAVALDLGLDGRHARADRATAADGTVESRVANTGGTVLALAPGLYVNATGRLWLFVRAQLPVYRDLLGEQAVLPSFTSGVQLEIL